jgi:hypothetical protein
MNTYGRNYIAPKPRIMETIGIASKKMPEVNKRIEILGQLNDRHKEATGAQDWKALRDLAAEYDAMKCPRLAEEIRAEAKATRKAKRVDPATPEMVV